MEGTSSEEYEINILQPPVLWINNRCYRKLIPISFGAQSSYMGDEAYPVNTYEDEVNCGVDSDIPYELLSNGKVQTSFPVASSYLPLIIGTKGTTKHNIENETYTQLKIPGKGQVGDIVVIGRDLKSVRQARIKIELLVDRARKRQPFTHFASIPFNGQDVQQRFIDFKNNVLEKFGQDRGVDASIFQTPAKLHLTIGVLVLADDRERREAVEVLQKAGKRVLSDYMRSESLRVVVKGIEYMNDDPGEVDVLYGKIDPSDSGTELLQELADCVLSELVNASIAQKQHERVKLHITLMNTNKRRGESERVLESYKNRTNERETFDARRILAEFRDYYFGEVEVNKICLSIRHSTASGGYYSSSCDFLLTSE